MKFQKQKPDIDYTKSVSNQPKGKDDWIKQLNDALEDDSSISKTAKLTMENGDEVVVTVYSDYGEYFVQVAHPIPGTSQMTTYYVGSCKTKEEYENKLWDDFVSKYSDMYDSAKREKDSLSSMYENKIKPMLDNPSNLRVGNELNFYCYSHKIDAESLKSMDDKACATVFKNTARKMIEDAIKQNRDIERTFEDLSLIKESMSAPKENFMKLVDYSDDFSYYSDAHKSMYGFRPHCGAAPGEYRNPHTYGKSQEELRQLCIKEMKIIEDTDLNSTMKEVAKSITASTYGFNQKDIESSLRNSRQTAQVDVNQNVVNKTKEQGQKEL